MMLIDRRYAFLAASPEIGEGLDSANTLLLGAVNHDVLPAYKFHQTSDEMAVDTAAFSLQPDAARWS